MNTAEVLKAAKGEIAAYGWCQNNLQDTTGRLCALGGIASALNAIVYLRNNTLGYTKTGTWESPIARAATLELLKHVPHDPACHTAPDFRMIARFNDAETTTYQDVMNLYDKALADLGAL